MMRFSLSTHACGKFQSGLPSRSFQHLSVTFYRSIRLTDPIPSTWAIDPPPGHVRCDLKTRSRAAGIELLFHFTKSRVFTVLPTASQINWSQMELNFASSRVTVHLPLGQPGTRVMDRRLI